MKYDLALENISSNPSSGELLTELDDWLGDAQRSKDDWVVIYYTGHGEIVGAESLYLLTRNYKSGKHVATAFPFRQLGDMVAGRTASGENRRTRRVLFILDTCFSGAGAGEIVDKLQGVFTGGSRNGMFYILSASFPNEEALTGGLSNALIASLNELYQKSTQQQYIYFDQLIPAVNKRLMQHKVYFMNIMSPDEEQQFFPNPYHIANGVPAISTTTTTTTTLRPQYLKGVDAHEFRNFWAPNARGVTSENETGWYFTARTKVLQDIAVWLKDKENSQLLVVTGPAGSGKSTILSAIVLLAQENSGIADKYTVTAEEISLFQQLDLAIHARGKTVEDIVHIIAAAVHTEPETAEILSLLGKKAQYFLLLDALDEAVAPQQICTRLLQPLSRLAGIKILIGSRPEVLAVLEGTLQTLYVDDDKYISRNEFESYISRRLEAISSYPPAGQAADKIEYLKAVQKISDKAYPNFLIGRLAVAALEASGTDITSFNQQLFEYPSSVNDAFELYLQRFEENTAMVRDILRPLAWSQGLGIPWDQIWISLANAFSGEEYDDEDIRWVMTNAGSFIAETLEFERSVFRLYHEAMVAFLRSDWDEVEANRIIVRALVHTVPLLPDNESRDWRLSHPYLLHYLPGHAAISGDLGWLTDDPLFLLCANYVKLYAVLIAQSRQISPLLLDVYQSAAHHIRDKHLSEAAAYLKLSAWKYGMESLHRHYAWRVLSKPWQVNWTIWLPPSSSNEIAHGLSDIAALTVGKWGESDVVAVCRSNGTVDIWDLDKSINIFNWDTGMQKGAKSLSLALTRGATVLVIGWSNGTLKTANLDSGEITSIDTGSNITLIHTARRRGEDVCICYDNESGLALRRLAGLNLIMQRKEVVNNKMYSIGDVRVAQQHCIFAVGDHLIPGDGNPGSNIFLFSLEDLSTIWHNPADNRGVFLNFQLQQLFNTTLAVISQDNWGGAEIWDLKRGMRVFRDRDRGTYSWIYTDGQKNYLLTLDAGKLIRSELRYSPITHLIAVNETQSYPDVKIVGEPRTAFQIRGREKLLTASNTFLHIWDIAAVLRSIQNSSGSQLLKRHTGGFTIRQQNASVIYIGVFGGIAVLDAMTGLLMEDIRIDSDKAVSLLRITTDEQLLVVVEDDNSIGVMDIDNRTGRLSDIRRLCKVDSVSEVFILERDGENILLAAVRKSRSWSVLMWNITTGEEMQPPTGTKMGLSYGQEDKPIEGLTAKVINNKLRIAFSSKYGMVNVVDYEDMADSPFYLRHWDTPENEGEYIKCLLSCHVAGRELLIAAAAYGRITIFDFESGQVLFSMKTAHETTITALCFFRTATDNCFISGDDAGLLKFWSFDLQEKYSIDLRSHILKIIQGLDGQIYAYTRQGIAMLELNSIPCI
jgi:WD40 repeat protein/energy-coupling factor transporter ATP-binding protein EcfA2